MFRTYRACRSHCHRHPLLCFLSLYSSRCPTSLAPANVIDTTVSLYKSMCGGRGAPYLWICSLWRSGGVVQEWVRPISGKWRNPVSNGLRTAKEGLAYPKIFLLKPPRCGGKDLGRGTTARAGSRRGPQQRREWQQAAW